MSMDASKVHTLQTASLNQINGGRIWQKETIQTTSEDGLYQFIRGEAHVGNRNDSINFGNNIPRV